METKTVLIPDEHYQEIMNAYSRTMNIPYKNMFFTLPVKSDTEGYVTFDITYEDFND